MAISHGKQSQKIVSTLFDENSWEKVVHRVILTLMSDYTASVISQEIKMYS
jgi:hypothetical protein